MDTKEFKLIHKGKNYKFTGNTIAEVLSRVEQFYSSVGVTVNRKQLASKIENQLKFAPVIQNKKIPKLSEAYHASLAMFKFAKGENVDQKTLDERTAVCLTCPLRAKTSFCAGCGGLSRATTFLNEARRFTRNQLKFNDKIKADFCGVCGCSLPLLLASKKEFLPEDDVQQAKLRPNHCWMKD